MAASSSRTSRLALLACLALGGAGCTSTMDGPEYGGMDVRVEIALEPSAEPQAAAAEPEVWLVDGGGWMRIDGQRRLPEVRALRREGKTAEADRLKAELQRLLDAEHVASFRGLASALWVPATTLHLIAMQGDEVAFTSFNALTQRKIELRL